MKAYQMILQVCVALVALLEFLSTVQSHTFVAKDGSGNFTTIMDAIQAVPDNSQVHHIIYIKEGLYVENIQVGSEKKNIFIIGQGVDKTIISGNRSCVGGFKTWDTATIAIEGNGFIAKYITIENTAGPEMQQAVALRVNADMVTFFQCRFQGFQDTIYSVHGYHFFRECEVFGTVDFIFGDSSVVFQNSIILGRKPLPGQYLTITAQGRTDSTQESGIILQNCTITATNDLRRQQSEFKYYFGRPWKNASRTVIMQSFIDSVIDPVGWIEWENQPPIDPYYAEYENKGSGADTSRRVKWLRVIKNITEASQFTVRNFLKGDTWIPSYIPNYLDLI